MLFTLINQKMKNYMENQFLIYLNHFIVLLGHINLIKIEIKLLKEENLIKLNKEKKKRIKYSDFSHLFFFNLCNK